jgi:hypothetical protein
MGKGTCKSSAPSLTAVQSGDVYGRRRVQATIGVLFGSDAFTCFQSVILRNDPRIYAQSGMAPIFRQGSSSDLKPHLPLRDRIVDAVKLATIMSRVMPHIINKLPACHVIDIHVMAFQYSC